MNKLTPLIVSIIGSILLVAQQFASQQNYDLKVFGIAALISVMGVVGTFLKGKGASVLGAVGATILTAVNVYQSGHFTWNEFILTAIISILSTLAPTLIPQTADKE